MSEIVLASILFGTAYIISNKSNNDVINEEFTESDSSNIKPNLHKSKLNMKIDKNLATSMDKYTIPDNNIIPSLTHNNMVPFYNNKSNGYDSGKYNNFESILDNHTGVGSQSIQKEETAQLFKPQDNMQNVWGNQNQNDFLQSRVNESNRFANTKPWEEIKDSAGNLGFNSGTEYRDKTMPKSVNDLRTINNPKGEYELNYKSPAYKPNKSKSTSSAVETLGTGKITKHSVNTYHVNNNMEGFGPVSGIGKYGEKSLQMLTNENRDDTSVSYYGVRKDTIPSTYIHTYKNETNKNHLPSKPLTNINSVGINPSINQNYGKQSYTILNNNRTDNNTDYFGNIKGHIFTNVVSPIVNTLKYTKKNNHVENPNPIGNINSNVKKPMEYNQYEKPLPTTNRQMTSESINHLNFQKQSSNAYINTNPYLTETQRQTTNQSYIGNAKGNITANTFENVYTKQNMDKTVENRMPTGNMNLFNSNINVNINGRDNTNYRTNSVYIPNHSTSHILGENTKQPQQYEYSTTIDESMVEAFKKNPYTHSLNSVA